MAAKTYYFSVGGGCRQFEAVVNEDNTMTATNERLIKGILVVAFPLLIPLIDGSSNVREILRLRWKE